ncbi:OmpP1/FadL family transporter [Falsiroseomonas sp. HW251]|uniref:OmpP1/FadL family transporter n=1 Tax=Falsiroseomonas sp. HW251 TaxID=3390998 RepID=UPI003D31B590
MPELLYGGVAVYNPGEQGALAKALPSNCSVTLTYCRGVLIAILAASASAEALASGYALREQSAVAQGASFAGATAQAGSPSALSFNPAAIALLTGRQAAVSTSLLMPRVATRGGDAFLGPAFGASPITGTVGSEAVGDAGVLALYGTAQIGSDLTFGIAATSPWGLVTKYDIDFVGRYHALTSELATLNVAPAIAWRPHPTLALGASLQIQQATARLSNAVDFGSVGAAAGLGGTGLRPGAADGRGVVEGTDWAFGYQLGLLWEPAQGTRLGVAFRSAVFHELRGDTRFEGVPAPLAAAFQDASARASFATPEVASVGMAQALGARWTLLAEAAWTNWSRFGELRVQTDGRSDIVTEQRWRDAWFVALGAEYRATDALTLRGGVAFDQSPVPEATRTPRIPDSDRSWFSIGASLSIGAGVELAAAYSHVVGSGAPVRLRDQGPQSTTFLRGELNLEYRSHVDIISLEIRVAF